MMRHEFDQRVAEIVGATVARPVRDDEWEDINFVYTYHPAIDNVHGKQQIAKLFISYGIMVIRDMIPRAQRFKGYADRAMIATDTLRIINEEMKQDKEER